MIHTQIQSQMQLADNLYLAAAVLLSAGNAAKIGDVGLARFMAADYMSQAAAIGGYFSIVHFHVVLSSLVHAYRVQAVHLLCLVDDIRFFTCRCAPLQAPLPGPHQRC
jgi:hypothetical protein